MIRSLRGTLAWTLAVEGCGVLAGLLTLRLAATSFGVEGFGAYTIARRVVSVAAFPLLLGFGIALPRAVARADAEPGGARRPADYGVAAGGLAALALACFALIVLAFPAASARLAFGTEARGLAVPTLVAVVGIAFHTLCYSWYRGRAAWTSANLMQLSSLSVVPPLAVALAGGAPGRALTYTGIGWAFVGLLGVLAATSRGQFTRTVDPRGAARELLAFGLPRVPGEFALFGLLALPAVMVAHRDGLAAAGYVSFALSLVQLSAAALSPVGTLLLPVVSREAALGNWPVVRRAVRQFLALGVGVSALFAIAIVLGAELLVHLLLGARYVDAIPTARAIAPAAIPYAMYLVLRNPLDAIAVHPHNTRNLLIAVALLWLLLGPAHVGPAAAIGAAYTILGLLSVWDWWRLSR